MCVEGGAGGKPNVTNSIRKHSSKTLNKHESEIYLRVILNCLKRAHAMELYFFISLHDGCKMIVIMLVFTLSSRIGTKTKIVFFRFQYGEGFSLKKTFWLKKQNSKKCKKFQFFLLFTLKTCFLCIFI